MNKLAKSLLLYFFDFEGELTKADKSELYPPLYVLSGCVSGFILLGIITLLG